MSFSSTYGSTDRYDLVENKIAEYLGFSSDTDSSMVEDSWLNTQETRVQKILLLKDAIDNIDKTNWSESKKELLSVISEIVDIYYEKLHASNNGTVYFIDEYLPADGMPLAEKQGDMLLWDSILYIINKKGKQYIWKIDKTTSNYDYPVHLSLSISGNNNNGKLIVTWKSYIDWGNVWTYELDIVKLSLEKK